MSCHVACFRWTASWWKDAGERMWHLDQGTVAEGHSQSWQVDVTSCCTLKVCSIVQLECLNAFELLCGSAIYSQKWCWESVWTLHMHSYTQVVPPRASCGYVQRIRTYNAREHMCCCMDLLSNLTHATLLHSLSYTCLSMSTVPPDNQQNSTRKKSCAAPFLLTWFQARREPCCVSQGTATNLNSWRLSSLCLVFFRSLCPQTSWSWSQNLSLSLQSSRQHEKGAVEDKFVQETMQPDSSW